MSVDLVENFSIDKHYGDLTRWHNMRGMDMIPPDSLPSTGKIIPGICAVFMYLTNSNVAFVEHLISNPEIDKSFSREGLDIVLKELETEAKLSGVKHFVCFTKLQAVKERADSLSYKIFDHTFTLLSKELT